MVTSPKNSCAMDLKQALVTFIRPIDKSFSAVGKAQILVP